MYKLIFPLLFIGAPLPRTNAPPVYPENPLDMSQGSLTNAAFTEAADEGAHWLNLMDQQQYGAAWADAGPLLKDIIPENQWVVGMKNLRQPLGNNLSRTRAAQKSLSMLAHGTKGNFILLSFRSQFSGNSSAGETIILMTNERGQWRVISYALQTQ